MTKTELIALRAKAIDVVAKVNETIRTLTAENPLTLFTEEEKGDDLHDEIYEYPYGYFVSKHSYYIQGAVRVVKGDAVELFLTGEDWGDTHHLELSDLPFESLVDLLEYLEEGATE